MKTLKSGLFHILGVIAATAAGAEQFQKINGTQIRAKLAGMEISDSIHSRDVFHANGTLATIAMGKTVTGKWRIQKDELCLERPREEATCLEVWTVGENIELRAKGSSLPFIEGVLRRVGSSN